MNDCELLELAAKASGQPWDQWVIQGDDSWNPIIDDGDALRLAVKLGMNVDIEIYEAVAYYGIDKFVSELATANFGIESATRRAIVRAAAEIGRQMQNGGAA